MDNYETVVVTGVAPVSSIGIGADVFWANLLKAQAGTHYYELFDILDKSESITSAGFKLAPAAPIAGYIADFSAKEFVQPRKNIKIMSRDVQLGLAAGALAIKHAQGDGQGTLVEQISPERVGIDLGSSLILSSVSDIADTCLAGMLFEKSTDITSKANSLQKHWGDCFMDKIFPLWLLKYLPNMAACHLGIANNLQGPSNTLVLGDVGALAATVEAIHVIQRGAADAMVVGGIGNFIDLFNWNRYSWIGKSNNISDPEGACRPFDATRDGLVASEAAACMVIESESSAKKRNVKPLVKIRAWASCTDGTQKGYKITGKSIRNCLKMILNNSGVSPDDISHINANGWGTIREDAIEAQAIADILPGVPVVALKGQIGYAGSGSAAVEMVATVLALKNGLLPPARNYSTSASDCPIQVVHGTPQESNKPYALTLTFDRNGAASAMMFEKV